MAADAEGIRIEHLAHGQLDALIDAQNGIFEDYIIPIRSSRQFFTDFLKSVGGDLRNVLVSLDGDRIVGYANPVVDGDEAWIGGIGVLPSHRGMGIGTKLMLAAERECIERGVREISLEVIEGNDQVPDGRGQAHQVPGLRPDAGAGESGRDSADAREVIW